MAKTPAKSAASVGKPHAAHKSSGAKSSAKSAKGSAKTGATPVVKNGAKSKAKKDGKNGALSGAKKAPPPAPSAKKTKAPAKSSASKPAAKAKPAAKPKPAAKAAPKPKGKAEKPASAPKPRKARPEANSKILHLIAEEMAIEEAELTANASFKEDLNLDEIDVAELLMQAETTFGVHPFNEEDWESCETVGDFTRMVEKRLEAKRKK